MFMVSLIESAGKQASTNLTIHVGASDTREIVTNITPFVAPWYLYKDIR